MKRGEDSLLVSAKIPLHPYQGSFGIFEPGLRIAEPALEGRRLVPVSPAANSRDPRPDLDLGEDISGAVVELSSATVWPAQRAVS
jgi:hypothetical protein